MTLILIIISVTCSTVLMRYSLVSPSHSSLSLVWLETSVLVHQISTSIIRVRFLCSHWLSQIILISDWSGPGSQHGKMSGGGSHSPCVCVEMQLLGKWLRWLALRWWIWTARTDIFCCKGSHDSLVFSQSHQETFWMLYLYLTLLLQSMTRLLKLERKLKQKLSDKPS